MKRSVLIAGIPYLLFGLTLFTVMHCAAQEGAGKQAMKAVYKFSYMIIDGIGYFEPEEAMTYDEAVKWAKPRGLRLLTRGEWCDLYDHKEEFRKSCRPEPYWTASLHIREPRFAWYFYGKYGYNEYRNRSQSCKVRAVLAEPDGRHNH